MNYSFFDGKQEFKNKKPIRLISLFSGYDSQKLAFDYLGIFVEHWKTCEWAVKSIQALKDLHFENDKTDYSKDLNKEQLITYLTEKGISSDYNSPMTAEQIKRLGETKLRTIYNNIFATHNLVNICNTKASDLEIVNTETFCYVMTYSFPCQDLSKAGKQAGMERGTGTRSGMLWEVERLLDECTELPQVLLMENVPDVIGSKNAIYFAEWVKKLETLGYKNYWRVLNATEFGIPQNRERCFMVSILGDFDYCFPQPIKLEKRLKDLLETNVDKKYFLSEAMVNYIKNDNSKWIGNNGKSIINRDIACTKTTKEGNTRTDCSDFISDDLPQNCNIKLIELTKNQAQANRIYDSNGLSVTLNANGGGLGAKTGLYAVPNLKTKLCNSLIENGKVQEGDVIRHSYSNSRMKKMQISNNEFHDCSPTLDTRCDCLGVVNNYRIRKLTPKECGRLMGVKDCDIEKIARNQSNASLYHLAGDSIVTNVLMAIFKNLF